MSPFRVFTVPPPLGQLPGRSGLYRGETCTRWNTLPSHGALGALNAYYPTKFVLEVQEAFFTYPVISILGYIPLRKVTAVYRKFAPTE